MLFLILESRFVYILRIKNILEDAETGSNTNVGILLFLIFVEVFLLLSLADIVSQHQENLCKQFLF